MSTYKEDEDFDEYFESFNTKGLTGKDVSKLFNEINGYKFDNIFDIKEVSTEGQPWSISGDESINKKEWDISYKNKRTNEDIIKFKVEFDENIGILYWKKGKSIAEHFVSNQFCDKVVNYFGGSVLFNEKEGVTENDFNFSQEYSTIDKYLDFVLLSGLNYSYKPKVFAESIKRNIKEYLGETLYSALNNECKFELREKKCI